MTTDGALLLLAFGQLATIGLCAWNAYSTAKVRKGVDNLHEVNAAVVARHDDLFEQLTARANAHADFVDILSREAQARHDSLRRLVARVETEVSDLDDALTTFKELIERERRGSKGGAPG